jgi:hypothetical protein
MSPAGIESKFSAAEQPQNLDRVATDIGQQQKMIREKYCTIM